MTQYFDTHAHYDSGKFNADRSDVLRAVHESGVALIVDPGDCAVTSARAVAIAQAYDFVYAAVGWHPEEAAGWTDDSLNQIRALASQPKVCAIGEIGLDYYWDTSTKATQETMLRAQLELALELDLPVIIHDREAHGDSLRIVCDYPGLRGVFHCFSGSVEIAQELIKRGWYLGFDGPLTYKNAKKTVEVAKIVPLDRVLLETDSPYMAPVPVRGTRNDSRNVFHIAAKFAEIRGMSTDEIIALANENGRRFFGIQSAKEERS